MIICDNRANDNDNDNDCALLEDAQASKEQEKFTACYEINNGWSECRSAHLNYSKDPRGGLEWVSLFLVFYFILSFCHSFIPSFFHFVVLSIPSFFHFVILSFLHSFILSFFHSFILSFFSSCLLIILFFPDAMLRAALFLFL